MFEKDDEKAGTQDPPAGDDAEAALTETGEGPEGGNDESDEEKGELAEDERAELARLRAEKKQHLAEKSNHEATKKRLDDIERRLASQPPTTPPAASPQALAEIEEMQRDIADLEYRATQGNDASARVILRQQKALLAARFEARDTAQFAQIPLKYRQQAATLYYTGQGRYGDPAAAYEALLGRLAHQRAVERREVRKATEKATGKKPAPVDPERPKPVSTVTRSAPKLVVKGKEIKASELERLSNEARGDPKKRREVLNIVSQIEAGKVKVLSGR